MSRRRASRGAIAALLVGLAAHACARPPEPTAPPELGLMGSIPIYWGEADDVAGLLGDDAAPHWARARLEADYRLRPLDTLSDESLADLDFLLLAQPRALAPAENVALDEWVRSGGRLLLFADPMLTGESRFPIGDRRRPQDVILLSPILGHWGLRLEFDADAAEGVEVVRADGGVAIPVNLAGRLAAMAGQANCRLEAQGILARCAVGEGGALVLADAALLDLHHPPETASAALGWLVDQAFDLGENAGRR